MAGSFCAKASHQDTHLCGILFDEPASLSKLACEMEKASHQDTHLCGILFDEPASSSRGVKASLLDFLRLLRMYKSTGTEYNRWKNEETDMIRLLISEERND